MNRRETERILDAIRAARRAGTRAALATVVRVRGSAYRREGARILIREDGSYECLLSGGCLEPAVAAAAARVIETGEADLAQYDLEEDSVWSLGIGCSGAVDILIEPVDDDAVTAAWLGVLERGEAGVLVKSLAGPGRLLVGTGDSQGTLGTPALDTAAAEVARGRLAGPNPQSGPGRVGDVELFFEVAAPPPELVLFGAGSDAQPLSRLAWELGFSVVVVDVREAFLTADRFAHATLVCAHHSEFPGRVRLGPGTSVVVMNHHLERDRECLRFALDSEARVIAALGPRSRFRRLLGALAADGYVPGEAAVARVRSPAGLALGAETPEEVALSIVAELLALERGFDGGFLNGRDESLHRPASQRADARS